MPKEPIHHCQWDNCEHSSRELKPGEGVCISKRWYHEDCGKKKQTMTEIRDYYYENINRLVVMSQLVATIKNICITKKADPEYVLFALKYAVKNNLEIRSPYGIHYLIASARVQDAWVRYNKRLEEAADFRAKIVEKARKTRQKRAQTTEHQDFVFQSAPKKRFGDILK